MSNVKVGGKVFRDVEKMNFEQLTEVAKAIHARMLELAAAGKRLMGSPSAASAVGRMDGEMQTLNKRLTHIENLVKQVLKKAMPDKPKEIAHE